MPTGTIKKLVVDRGFGFIKQDAGGPDLFFHCRDLARDAGLQFDDRLQELEVQFDVTETPKGARASLIRPLRTTAR